MQEIGFRRIVESGVFVWPWKEPQGLLVIRGAAGGGGGGGGAFCLEVATELASLRIIHDSLEATDGFDADPSHAEITGLPPGDSDHAVLVGDLIAECVIAMHPAVVGHDG